MITRQPEIVRQVERRLVVANQIEARQSAALRQVDALTPSCLAHDTTEKIMKPSSPN